MFCLTCREVEKRGQSGKEVFIGNGKVEDVQLGLEFEGPLNYKRRKCRDVSCLILLGLFLLIQVGMITYAAYYGDIRRLLMGGYDSQCDICGVKNRKLDNIPGSGQDKTDFPYLIFQPDDSRFDYGLQYLGNDNLYLRQCFKPILNRCIPHLKNFTAAADFYSKFGLRNFYQEVAEDFEESWKDILIMCLIALCISLLMTFLLRFVVKTLIWFVIIGVTFISIAATIFLWIYYSQVKKKLNKSSDDWDYSKVNNILAISILTSIITIVILIVVIGLRKQITLVAEIFNEAGKAVASMPFLLLQPIFTFLALGLTFSGCIMSGILIESSGKAESNINNDGHMRCRFVKDTLTLVSRWWNLFCAIWLSQFIIACQHLVISGAVAKWFFTRKKESLQMPIIGSLGQLIGFHLGSAAFGSLIIAFFKFIRILLSLFQNAVKKYSGKSSFCDGILQCCKCLTWCMEKILVFLNKNAYIEIAIYGCGFCQSARKAFNVLVSNALRVAAINSIGDLILFLAKIVIVALTLFIGYQLIKDKDTIHYVWVPLVIAGFFAYFVANCFISVYEMTIDTIFICFCEDCAHNDGLTKPYFMSKSLMDLVKRSKIK